MINVHYYITFCPFQYQYIIPVNVNYGDNCKCQHASSIVSPKVRSYSTKAHISSLLHLTKTTKYLFIFLFELFWVLIVCVIIKLSVSRHSRVSVQQVLMRLIEINRLFTLICHSLNCYKVHQQRLVTGLGRRVDSLHGIVSWSITSLPGLPQSPSTLHIIQDWQWHNFG